MLVVAGCSGKSSIGVSAQSTPPEPAPGSYVPPPAMGEGPRAGASVEVGKPEAPDTELGWNVQVGGDRTRWQRCTDKSTCTRESREKPSAEVVAVEKVGEGRITRDDGTPGDLVDVMRIKLKPR